MSVWMAPRTDCGDDEALVSHRNTNLSAPKASRHPDPFFVLLPTLVIDMSKKLPGDILKSTRVVPLVTIRSHLTLFPFAFWFGLGVFVFNSIFFYLFRGLFF